MSVLEKIKLLKPGLSEEIIKMIIENEESIILEKTKRKTLNKPLEIILFELALWRLNLLGTEGLASESYSGSTSVYLQDIPIHIKDKLKSFRKVRTL